MYWYEKEGKEQDIFLSTRVRFARNLRDYPFEPALDAPSAREIIERVDGILKPLGYESVDKERGVLYEKRLISREMAEKKTPSEIYTKDDCCIMVCEEDHLRIQAIKSGLDLEGAFKACSEAEQALDEKLRFAFSEELGYLTHCPTNLGCAMRVSVMMFLPCLSEAGKMKMIERELSRLGITVRGSGGEGSGAEGCLYQISNSVTMGVTEEEILENVRRAAESIVLTERELRRRMKEADEDKLRDRLLRSYGSAMYAFLTDSGELYRFYANIRLAAILGYVPCNTCIIDKMLFENLPYHIISRKGELSALERDKERARAVSEMLRKASS